MPRGRGREAAPHEEGDRPPPCVVVVDGARTEGSERERLLLLGRVRAVERRLGNVAGQTAFVLLGLGGAAAGLALAGAAWRGRFRGVRRPLVEAARRRAT